MSPPAALTVLLVVVLGIAALLGRAAVVVVALAVSVLLLVDLHGLLRRVWTPPILPAAAVLGLGAPVAAALGASEQTAAVAFAALVVAAVATLVGRRREATEALGATLVAGLLPGLGGSAVILLWDSDPLTLLALVGALAAGEGGLALARRRGGLSREREAAVALVAVVLAGAVSVVFLPLETAAGIAALALLGVLGAGSVRAGLLRSRRWVPGLVLASTASLALAAPAVLAVAGRL